MAYKQTKVEKEMSKHDFNITQHKNKIGKHIAGVKMPMNVDDDMKMALMWYYISWHNKIGKWSADKKMRYAKEVSQISSIVPIHLIGRNNDGEQVVNIMKSLKIKLFGFENNKFVMFDENGKKLQELTGTNLYALLVYLVDSLSKGLEDQVGFDFIKLAKVVIKGPK